MAKPTGAVCNLDSSGLNHLCAGYTAFFHHVDEPMRFMADQLRQGRAPAEIIAVYAAADARRGRNEPRSCGSGRKWKAWHGAAPLARPHDAQSRKR